MEYIFPRAINVDALSVKCTDCGGQANIICSGFGMYPESVVRTGDCICDTYFPLEDFLMHFDQRTIYETLSLLGYSVPTPLS